MIPAVPIPRLAGKLVGKETRMRFLRRHWYEVGAAVAVAASIVLIVLWLDMGVLQRLLLLNFITLLVHQFEEYGWPGGLPAIINMAVWPSPTPNRYPLNQNSSTVVNLLAVYGFYLVPVFFPTVIWLGLGPVLYGVFQLVFHAFLVPIKLRCAYNPGLAMVVLGHVPVAACYFYYIHSHGLVGIWDWVFGVAYMAAFHYVCLLKMTYTWLADRDSQYPFTDEEMRRFNVAGRIERLATREGSVTAQPSRPIAAPGSN